MAETKDIIESTKTPSAVQTRDNEALLQPPVDIYEDAEGITLLADMPGVSAERLNIQIDKDTLVIEGESKLDMPEGINPLYADIRASRYRRSFALSSELDTDNIDASLKDGVLNL